MSAWTTLSSILVVKLLILLYCTFGNLMVDHKATDVAVVNAQFSSKLSEFLLNPFTKWDSVYYIDIASKGYTNEKELAFFPLYPALLRNLATLLNFGNIQERIIASGLLLDLICFIVSFFMLTRILEKLNLNKNMLNNAQWCFLLNPANVFFTSIYTESLFAALSWSGMALCLDNTPNSEWLAVVSGVFFFLASSTRSNGMFNGVFVLIIALSRIAKDCKAKKGLDWQYAYRTAWMYGCIIVSTVLPYFMWSWYSYIVLCDFRDPHYIGNPTTMVEYCSSSSMGYLLSSFSSPYGYIQSKYWNVGAFRYYHWRQIPNFLLAAPITIIVLHCLYRYSRIVVHIGCSRISALRRTFNMVEVSKLVHRTNQSVPIALCAHIVVLLLVGYIYAHIQILTRLLCSSSPLVYVALAYLLESRWSGHIVVYLTVYNVVGALLHVNHYPWT